jgi:hypothetical protein
MLIRSRPGSMIGLESQPGVDNLPEFLKVER